MDESVFFPSRWSKRLSRSEIEANHMKFIETESERVRKTIQCELNIPYGPSERQRIDIFGTDLNDDAPIFVFIHGGYWQTPELNRYTYEFVAENLHKNSVKSIFVSYDICPDVTLGEIVKQIEKAARLCVNYACNKNSKGVYFCGHSAGGHLVASLFTGDGFISTLSEDEQILVKAVISISGVFDLAPLVATEVNDLLHLDEQQADDLSPIKHEICNGAGTVFYLIVAEQESPWFLGQSKEFCEKVTNQGFCGHYWVVPDVDHFNIIERLIDTDFELTKHIIDIID